MARKILYGALIGVSGILLVLSVMGIGAAWAYNEPLTQQGVTRLSEIDRELSQAQSALSKASSELSRALRIIEGAEAALAALSRTKAAGVHVDWIHADATQFSFSGKSTMVRCACAREPSGFSASGMIRLVSRCPSSAISPEA